MTRSRRWLCAAASLATAFASNARAASIAATSVSEASAEAAGPAEAGPAPSAPPLIPALRPEEQLLLQVRTDQWILDEAFTG